MLLDKKANIKLLLVFFSIILVTFCLLLSSPLSPWGSGYLGVDSSVFRTIAMQMDKGYVPYKDIFDHKGPLLYLINYLGFKINFQWGVWLIEFIFMVVNFMALFFTSKLLNKSYFISFVSIIPSILFLYSLEVHAGLNGGNYAEDYILPFLMISLCLFVDYILNDRVTNVRIAICGMCCACAMMLKFNFAMVWFVFGLIILLNEIKNKNYIMVRKIIVYFLLGLSIVLIPFLLWLYCNGALKDFWYCYIIFNRKYANYEGGLGHIENLLIVLCENFSNIWLIIIMICTCVLILTRKLSKKSIKLLLVNIIYIFITVCFIALPGRHHIDYAKKMLAPFLLIPFAVLFNIIVEQYKKIPSNKKITVRIITVLVAASICIICYINIIIPFQKVLKREFHIKKADALRETIDVIKNNSNEDDTIVVMGNYNLFYVLSDRIPGIRYSYQYPPALVEPKILEEVQKEIEEKKPELIIFPSVNGDLGKLDKDMEEKNYKKIAQVETGNNTNILMNGKNNLLCCYKKAN